MDQFLASGVPVFNCEYAFSYADSAYARSYNKGYIPYVTRRSLGKLTTTLPPDILTSLNSHEEDEDNLPTEYALYQNYPNPFNPSTTIKYSLPRHNGQASIGNEIFRSVQLKVYDVLGQAVTTLVNQKQSVGNYEVSFNANNLSSGIYFYQIKTENFVYTKKMLLLE